LKKASFFRGRDVFQQVFDPAIHGKADPCQHVRIQTGGLVFAQIVELGMLKLCPVAQFALAYFIGL